MTIVFAKYHSRFACVLISIALTPFHYWNWFGFSLVTHSVFIAFHKCIHNISVLSIAYNNACMLPYTNKVVHTLYLATAP